MESDFAFFLPDTFIIITQRGGGEFSLRKSDFVFVAKVQQREKEGGDDAEQERAWGK